MWHFLHKMNMILKFFNATLKILQGLHIYLKILALYIVKIESHFFRNILVKINKCSPWKKNHKNDKHKATFIWNSRVHL